MTTAFDRWLTTEPDSRIYVDELDPIHSCGHPWSDHETVQRTDPDGGDYETRACPSEDEAALWLRYMAEANEAAAGSPEDGPGDMSDWPSFQQWKSAGGPPDPPEPGPDLVTITMHATLEIVVDLTSGQTVAARCWTPNVANGQLHDVATADSEEHRRGLDGYGMSARTTQAFDIAEATDWPNPELRA